MRKTMKKLWFLPILLVSIILGALLVPQFSKKDTMAEFQEFTDSYVNLIQSQGEIENFEGIKINLENDLKYQDGVYKISGNKFAQLTGAKLSYAVDSVTISHENTNITLYNDSNTIRLNSVDIDVLPSTSNITSNEDILFPIEKIASSLGYEITTNDDTMTLYRPYITKRLLVTSKSKLNDFGAISKVEGYDNLHIFQYATEEQTIEAYNYYKSLDNIDNVEVDSIVVPSDFEETQVEPMGMNDSFSYQTWGAEAMGVDKYSQYLINEVTEANFPEIIVAVLDTGLDNDHSWFSGRIAEGGANFSSSTNETCVYQDVYGHGTHVAGIIVDLTFSNVKILPIKVMNDNGYGFSSSVKLGIDYINQLAIDNDKIVAMNFSLGTINTLGTENYTDFKTKIDTAYSQHNILSIAAAGNSGEDCNTSAPANIDNSITVSAVSHINDVYFRPEWSNFGSYIDVSAPGGQILSAKVGGGTTTLSGTSMAAPHITAVIALFYTDINKNYTVSDIEELLDTSSIDLGDEGWDKYYGEGMVNIEHANATLLDDVTFSVTTTDHTEAFYLELTSPSNDATVYYTVNNDRPTIYNSTPYSEPIYISATQKISAVAFKIENDQIVAYSRIRTIMYCFYGEDIADAYTVTDDGTLTKYNGGFIDITVPKTVNGITITAIGREAFANSYVQSITLPSTVTQIGYKAFYNCPNLMNIFAPSVTSVGLYSFFGCTSLSSITDQNFPALLKIDKYAFTNCLYINTLNLTNVKVVDFRSFYMSSANEYLTEITLPNATTIGETAFYNCTNLRTINIPSAKIIASEAFLLCDITGDISLPSLTHIGSRSFYRNANITSLDMPNVEIIGSQCCYNYCTKLTSVNAPKVRIVGSKAFNGCYSITNLVVDELHEASSEAFAELANLQEINLPKLQYAGKNAFSGLSISYLDLPNIIKISALAFERTIFLARVNLPSSLEYIDSTAFQSTANGCTFYIYDGTIAKDFVVKNFYQYQDVSTTNNSFAYTTTSDNEIYITGYNGDIPETLTIPSYINSLPVTKICSVAFRNCLSIYNLNLSKVTEIEEYAFIGCSNLQSVTLNSIETIQQEAFKNCANLSEVNIYNVKTIGDGAFYNCPSLLKVKLSKDITSIGSKSLGYLNDDQLIPTFELYGHKGTPTETYAQNLSITFHAIFNQLSSFYFDYYDNNGRTDIYIQLVDSYASGSLILPSSYNGYVISKIGAEAFMNCSFITGITLPSTITSIEERAFYECSMLEEINLDNVTYIGEKAFTNCSSLLQVNLGAITEIPTSCFDGCERISYINLPNVTKIGTSAFNNCYDLRTVVCPNLEYVEARAFRSCSSLESINTLKIKGLGTVTSNTEYDGQTFAYCNQIKSAYFPNLEYITPNTFSNTLEKAVIGDKLLNVWGRPFTSPTKVYGYLGSLIIQHALTASLDYEVIDKLSITTNLVDSVQCYRFEEKSLTIETTGFEQKYQWYKTDSNIENGIAIDGETTNTLSLDTDVVGSNNYYVVVTDWNGETMTSDLCSVSVFNSDSAYIISASSSSNGSFSINPTNYVNSGDNFSVTFIPNTGCFISSLIIDGIPLSKAEIDTIIENDYTYTFTNVTKDHTIVVTYESANFNITVIQPTPSQYGTISEAKDSYMYGTSGYFSISPATGYYTEYIIIDGQPVENTANATEYMFENITEDHTISAKISPRTDIIYKVNHYQKSLNNTGIYINTGFYTIESTDTLYGTTNEMTNAQHKEYLGFYYTAYQNALVKADGSTVINIFYERETYSVSIFKGTGIDSVTGAGEYLFGETVTITATLAEGYTFSKWESGNEGNYFSSNEISYTFTIISQNADFTAIGEAIDSPEVPIIPNTPSTPTEPDTTPTTPTTPSTDGGSGGGMLLGVIGGGIGLIVIIIIVVVVKKSRRNRF